MSGQESDGEEFDDDASFASLDDLEGTFQSTNPAYQSITMFFFIFRGRRNTSAGIVETCRERSRVLQISAGK